MWDNARYRKFEEMITKHDAKITGITKVSQNEMYEVHWIRGVSDDGRENVSGKCSNKKGSRS